MLEVIYTSTFKKDAKRIKRRRKDVRKLYAVIDKLIHQKPLPHKMKDHALIGNYAHHRECHIEPDWLLIYRILDGVLRLELTARADGEHFNRIMNDDERQYATR